MAKQLTGGKQVSVAAKKEVIDKGLKRLLEKGFTLQKVKPKDQAHQLAVDVDRRKRVITVVEDHPSFRDEITVRGKTYLLEFARLSENDEPCKFRGKRTIVVNTAFRLFQSRRYGELFKRFCIVSLVASTSSRTASSMLQFILKEIQTQFASYK
jgi:hypothetical protein